MFVSHNINRYKSNIVNSIYNRYLSNTIDACNNYLAKVMKYSHTSKKNRTTLHIIQRFAMTKEASILGKTVFGVKEYLTKSPKLEMKAGDAGLVVMGISAGGTAFGLGSPTYFPLSRHKPIV